MPYPITIKQKKKKKSNDGILPTNSNRVLSTGTFASFSNKNQTRLNDINGIDIFSIPRLPGSLETYSNPGRFRRADELLRSLTRNTFPNQFYTKVNTDLYTGENLPERKRTLRANNLLLLQDLFAEIPLE